MSLVNVCYRVPVVAVVNTKTGKIEQVIVDDQSISEPEFCEDHESAEPIKKSDKRAKRAVAIAESECWPSWSVGF